MKALTIRKWIPCLAVAALANVFNEAGAQTSPAAAGTSHPHVIMIFTDDMGYSDISSFANTPLPVTTPNIDRLATEGRKFTHFYVAMPICSPSRAAVLSGRFAPETGLTNFLQQRTGNNNSDQEDYMDPVHAHLPKTFQAAGYRTAHVGKWHLGGGRDVDNALSISKYGYHEAYSTWESPNPDPELGIAYAPWDTNTEPGQVPRYRRTEYMVNKTLEILQRSAGTPCFITLWPDDLHTPFWPSPEMRAKHGGESDGENTRADFYGVLEEYDRQIGRLLDGLAAQGIANDTIIFFTGDNGPAPDFGRERTNGMNGNKLSLYEGGIRQPFLIRWPGHIPAGTTNDQTILSTVDLLPTLSSLAGIDMLPEAAAVTDGEDLSAAVLGSSTPRANPLMWEYGRTGSVPRPGTNDVDRSPILAIREGDFKLLLNPNNTGHELYNVRTDPGEYTNLAAQNPTLVQSLSAKVLAWRASLPGRMQPYPPFATVDFGQYGVQTLVGPAALAAAAGADSTLRIDGVSAGPNGHDDVYAIHVDAAEREILLRIDIDTGAITRVTDSGQVAAELGAMPSVGLSLRAGFDYSPPGDRVFLVDTNLAIPGQAAVISVSLGTGRSTLVKRSSDYAGLNDHGVLPRGDIVGVRDGTANRTVGVIDHYTGQWTELINQSQLMAAAPGSTQAIPEAISINSSSGDAHLFSHADPALFRITAVNSASPGITKLTQAALAGADFHDLAEDQAGNMYGYDEAGQKLVVIRRSDNAVFQLPLATVASRLGSAGTFTPTRWRGLAARMTDDTHADLFLASSNAEHGIVRVSFGTAPAAVSEWSLY